MEETLILVRLDTDYCNYLRKYDQKVPYNYDEKLYGRFKKLYDKYVNGTLDSKIAKRCCNFKLLEEKCKQYNQVISG